MRFNVGFYHPIKGAGGQSMRSLFLVPITGLFFLVACNDAKKPSNANFTVAINQYLAKHGETCTPIGRQFPINVPKSKQNDQSGIGPKLTALEQAGLVHASDTTAVVHSLLDPLRGPTPPQPVKRYDLTDEGKKYLRQIPDTFGQTSGFCYGQKSVDSIVKWTEPAIAGPHSQADVVYTYKILNLAPWAERPDAQQAFPDIKAVVSGASTTNQKVGLQLTNKGWEVPGP
jgi:hypothetical protein